MDRMLPICSSRGQGGRAQGVGTAGVDELRVWPESWPVRPACGGSARRQPRQPHVFQRGGAVEECHEELVQDGVEHTDAEPGTGKGHDHQVHKLQRQYRLAQEAAVGGGRQGAGAGGHGGQR